jgi:signal transduction histidine kinase
MKLHTRIIIYALILSILYCILDSIIDHFVFYKDLTFLQVFITNPPAEALYTRLLGMAVIIILGLIINGMLRIDRKSREITEKQDESTSELSHDPDLMINLSYQIKTPLSAILGFSELLKDPTISDESKKIYVNHIHTSGKYLLELVNNVTDIIKIETGQLLINKSPCRINKLLQEIHSKFEGQLKEKGKKGIRLILKTGIEDENFTFLTDHERLKQVIDNLLENAVRFTDDGYIEFGYNKKDDLHLEFYVKDTGAGFSIERLEMIMEKFKTVLDNRMRPFDTAALRINISKHLAQLLDGTLRAESVLWEGSTFTITIPLAEEGVYREEEAPEKEIKIHLWKDKQILIAEDVESNFIYLREILRPTQVQIHWAHNGREAVEICNKNKDISLVLMDILMPEMDGYEAARLVKKGRPDLPVIAQTAYTMEGDEYQESLKYFDNYLTKPIWSRELLNALWKYLE